MLVPAAERHEPRVHGKHASVDGEAAPLTPAPATVNIPTGQLVAASDPATQKEPAGHDEQPPTALTPVAAEKVPAGHWIGAALPAGQ